MRDIAVRNFLDKSEMVINFLDKQLSFYLIEQLLDHPRAAIVELAGRDSVAAAIKAVEEHSFTAIVPTYVYTGTEYGNWNHVIEAFKNLNQRISKEIRIIDLLVFGSPKFWHALNGRFLSILTNKFGFITACVGCHMYLHSVRIPTARRLGNIPIISGERELHNDKVKINQTSPSLDAYKALAEKFEVELLYPLRNISDRKEIDKLVGETWEEGERQLKCSLGGSYRPADGNLDLNSDQLNKYFTDFASPVTVEIIEAYLKKEVPNHLEIAEKYIRRL